MVENGETLESTDTMDNVPIDEPENNSVEKDSNEIDMVENCGDTNNNVIVKDEGLKCCSLNNLS